MTQPNEFVVVVDTPVDWLSLGLSIAGLVGLIVAVVSLIVTFRRRNEAIRDAAKERRTTFEMTVLRDLLPYINARAAACVNEPAVKVLLTALPERDLPLLRFCRRTADEGRVPPGNALDDKLSEYEDRYPRSQRLSRDERGKLALMDEIRQGMEARVK